MFFSVDINLGPRNAEISDDSLAATANDIDRLQEADATCLSAVLDGNVVFTVRIDTYDATSARLNALYLVRDALRARHLEYYADIAAQQLKVFLSKPT